MLETELEDYIKRELLQDGSIESIPHDLDLIGTGILNSLKIMELITYLENVQQVQFMESEISFENFNSISSITQLLNRR
ncbi:hypothetical protein JFU18_28080 [Bacillus sp. TH22]|uniref:hypothetical protein n=1 Tax=Bacillus TaxID=1386 RepID=UPI0011EF5FFF|nr:MULTISPECIES: hypothetical protein [Bacillus]MBK5360416.1 hypothetical protein [Bacillus sp. TH44]MBK5345645.1 hypothetical protein [Bacillus sp. TH45]MBK5367312.1 hypothetical protein [Bacillus sp. TH50]MBK5452325.1 hypothetical protein [Bacillus sp. TH22]MBK5457759.1 hypothetical protein [Bacillus sp. TH23]